MVMTILNLAGCYLSICDQPSSQEAEESKSMPSRHDDLIELENVFTMYSSVSAFNTPRPLF